MARQTKKLGVGEFESEHAGESLPSIEVARTCFLEAVSNLLPEVLNELAGGPYNLFKQTNLYFEADHKRSEENYAARYLWNRNNRPAWADIESPSLTDHPLIDYREFWQCSSIDTDERILAFRQCLMDWSREYRLDERWCRERAYETLDWWCFSPASYENRSWKFELAWPHPFLIGGEPRFVFERKTQYPLINSHEYELETAVEEFRRKYDMFLSKIDEDAEASGMKRTSIEPLIKHFEWLVRYHIQEWNYAKIADFYKRKKPEWDSDENKDGNADDNYIRHKVPMIARLIGLKLKNRRGRPPRS